MKRIAIAIFLLSGLHSQVISQTNLTKGFYLGGTLKNNGWGINCEYQTQIKSGLRKNWEFEFNTLKHSKEVNIVNPNARNPRTYVYGKLNKVGLLKVQSGVVKHVTDFRSYNNIQLSVGVSGGLSLAALKPVYLDIYHPNASNDGLIISERYNPQEHVNQFDILGNSKPKYGWGELSFKWGVQVKPSINLHWGGLTGASRILKVGVMGEYYPSGMPIMAKTDNPKLYFSIFLSFLIGNETEL
ncbi:MAG: hypothetical protein KA981_03615 [Bacteroidia bacterium]|jgi:hypothetical protein|nr:hypothetical protein [Bacteroidia bacterium]